jgi:heavy metal translocating P-type ATPase
MFAGFDRTNCDLRLFLPVIGDLEPSMVHETAVDNRRRPARDELIGARIPAASWRPLALLVLAVLGLAAGGVLWLVGHHDAADGAWAATAVVGIVPALAWVIGSLRRRQPGVDLIAVLALGGAIAVGEYLAGSIITVMLATGRLLEARAAERAERELRRLLGRAPRMAHRYAGGTITDVPLADVRPGDLVLVRPGEVIGVDGRVEGATEAVVDESALTGEAVPVERAPGDAVRSGVVNAGAPFDLRVTTSASDSTYAGIVHLVEGARAKRAPFVRMADRYAAVLVPVVLAIAGAAWLASGDAVRAVAVLVVATPCPLILAAPVALVSGMSRSARRGVIVKGGDVLERLAHGRVLLFDKTGTITRGEPTVADVQVAPGGPTRSELIRLAASLDQVSAHVLASAIVRDAHRHGLQLSLPSSVEEVPGHGARGSVEGHVVSVGRRTWVGVDPDQATWVRGIKRSADLDGNITVFVDVDHRLAGAILLADPVRNDAASTVRGLRRCGIDRVVMVTGDRPEVAEGVAAVCDVDEVLAERSPAEKVEAVRLERRGGSTIMVGDGINDAPALAAADVGVAIGVRGATASSEAADAVLTLERLDRVGDAVRIAQRALRIARQSVVAGMGLSIAAMGAAAAGFLPPTFGALLQEAIDVAVILNALRVTGGRPEQARLEAGEAEVGRRFIADHLRLRGDLEGLRSAADALGTEPSPAALARVRSVHEFLVEELLPHEEAEDAELYPLVAQALGGSDPTGTMSRAHAEISHLAHRLGRLLDDLPPEGPDTHDIQELRRVLYGLYAILRLHFAQEDEGYLTLIEEETPQTSQASVH